MNGQNQPVTIFGVSLKGILVTIIFLIIIFVVIDPFKMKSDIRETLPVLTKYLDIEIQAPRQDTHIDATPEMVSEAIRELRNTKVREYEQTSNDSPADRFYYIIELHNGGDLEASEVKIEPEAVTITSSSGIETVVPRSTIKDVRRYKLPPLDPAPAQQ